MIPNLRVEVLEPLLVKGLPKQEDVAQLDRLADLIVERHQKDGFSH